MWKAKAGVAVAIALVSLVILAVTEPSYANQEMRGVAKVMAGLGAALALWITFKAGVFGTDRD